MVEHAGDSCLQLSDSADQKLMVEHAGDSGLQLSDSAKAEGYGQQAVIFFFCCQSMEEPRRNTRVQCSA